jgi:hypothetical protein
MGEYELPPFVPGNYRKTGHYVVVEVGNDRMLDEERRLFDAAKRLGLLNKPRWTSNELSEILGFNRIKIWRLKKNLVELGVIGMSRQRFEKDRMWTRSRSHSTK